MTLYEPISGLLPATEEEILAAFPRVHPDTLRYRLRRLERAGEIKRLRDGKFVKTEPLPDEPLLSIESRQKIAKARKRLSRKKRPKMPIGVRVNPVNESQLKVRVCVDCHKEYVGIAQHFGNSRNKRCIACRA